MESLLPFSGQGTHKFWDGTVSSGNFTFNSNWSPSGVPDTGDVLMFPGSTA